MAKFCHHCGAPLEDDAAFCASCGTRQVAPAAPASAPAGAPAPAPAPKKKKTGLIVGIASAVAVVALILVGVLYVWPNFLSRDARYDRQMSNAAAALSEAQYDDARAAYGKAIALGTGRADPCIGLGDLLLLLEDYDEAVEAYESALALEPERAEVYLKLADAYLADDDREAAIEILEQGLEATDGSKKLDERLRELRSPFGDLSALLGEMTEAVERSPLGQSLSSLSEAASFMHAFEATAAATAASAEIAPSAALTNFFSALAAGQTSASLHMADERDEFSAQADLCTDLAAGELSLSGWMNYDGNSIDGTLYLGTEFGALHSGLLGSDDWYGATWASLPDDLEASALFERGLISSYDIDELREIFSMFSALREGAGGLDLSGLDLEPYIVCLLSAEPEITVTGDGNDGCLSFTFQAADFITAAADLLDLLASDEALRSLAVSLIGALDADAGEELRWAWSDELGAMAQELRGVNVSGTYIVNIYTEYGRVSSVEFSADPAVDGDALRFWSQMIYSYDGDLLASVDLSLSVGDSYDTYGEFYAVYRVLRNGDEVSESLLLEVYDGYSFETVSVGANWDRATGELSFYCNDDYDAFTFPCTLVRRDAGTELTIDLAMLLGLDESDTATLTIASYPGQSYVERPSRFVNLDQWDSAVLDRFSEAGDRLETFFNPPSGSTQPATPSYDPFA